MRLTANHLATMKFSSVSLVNHPAQHGPFTHRIAEPEPAAHEGSRLNEPHHSCASTDPPAHRLEECSHSPLHCTQPTKLWTSATYLPPLSHLF